MNRMIWRGTTLLLATCVTVLLSSCGSGAVSSSSDPAIVLTVSPSSATAYSGVPATFVITGGGARAPYQITSSNPTLLPVPSSAVTGTQFVLTPSAVAAQQVVTISVMDQAGKTATSSVTIQPNFINSDITITGTAPPAFASCAGVAAICAGQSGTATLTVNQNGVPARGRSIRFDVAQGNFGFPVDAVQSAPFPTSATVVSDESGRASVVLRANTDAAPQIATIRATDVASGAFRTATFFIKQAAVGGGQFVTIPPEWIITNRYKGECAGGVVDYLIFGGTPPYAIRSSAPFVAIASPAVTAVENPSRFTVTFPANSSCGTGYQVIFTVTDNTGLTIQPILTNTAGTEDRVVNTPPPSITLEPNSIPSLACGQSQQVRATVNNPGTTAATVTTSIGTPITGTAITAPVANGVITISRGSGKVGNSTAVDTQATINVGAGSATAQISIVSTPTICP